MGDVLDPVDEDTQSVEALTREVVVVRGGVEPPTFRFSVGRSTN
jgi:hypothetical protein